MRCREYIILVLIASALAQACSFLHDDKVVARVGGSKLYKSQVVKFIPPGASVQDSLALAAQYINAWAGELIMNRMAEKYLSKKEKDVSAELEEYRTSLLQYRYEEHYIADRLDTLVTPEQIQNHYDSNKMLYKLATPLVKARYVCIPSTLPMMDEVRNMLASDEPDDRETLDTLSHTVASKFTDYGGEWVDIVTVARDFGTDYGTLLSKMKKSYIDIVDEQGMEHIAFVSALIPSGRTAPVEYCREKIRDVIVEQRRYALSVSLEQDLLSNAREEGYFEVYETDEK